MQVNQGIVQQTTYAPFGDVLSRTAVQNASTFGRAGDATSATGGYGFADAYTDPNGLLYLNARYMNPTTGSFLSRDPVQGVIGGAGVTYNPYSYAQNNPVNMVDPNGEFALLAAGLFVFGGGMDVGFQMLFEGRSLDEVNFGRAAVSGLTTVAGGAFGKALHAASITGRAAFAAGAVADFGVGVAADRYLIGDSWGTAVASNVIGFGVGEFLGYAGRGIGRGIANSRFGRAAGATGSVCHSFSADTLVSTPDGDIAISEIVVGDTVYAYNEETGEVEAQTVVNTFEHDDDQIVYLTIDGEEIETTPWHPFYTNEGWTDAGDLEPGDLILALDGNYGTVESVVIVAETQTMYDLDVETVDTFAVGDGAWVVHNFDITTYCNIRITVDDPAEFSVEAISNSTNNRLLRFDIDKERRRLSAVIQTRSQGQDLTGYGLSGWQIWDGLWNNSSVNRNINSHVDTIGAFWERSGLEDNLNMFNRNIDQYRMTVEEAAFNTHTGRYAYNSDFTGLARVAYPTNNRSYKVVADFVRPNAVRPAPIFVWLPDPILPPRVR